MLYFFNNDNNIQNHEYLQQTSVLTLNLVAFILLREVCVLYDVKTTQP